MFWGDTYSKALESTLVEPNSMRTQPIPYESHQTRKNLNSCPASHARPSQAPTLRSPRSVGPPRAWAAPLSRR